MLGTFVSTRQQKRFGPESLDGRLCYDQYAVIAPSMACSQPATVRRASSAVQHEASTVQHAASTVHHAVSTVQHEASAVACRLPACGLKRSTMKSDYSNPALHRSMSQAAVRFR